MKQHLLIECAEELHNTFFATTPACRRLLHSKVMLGTVMSMNDKAFVTIALATTEFEF